MQYINTWFMEFKIPLISLIGLLLFGASVQAKLPESDPLPDLSGFELSGELPDLEGKVVLVDFWASWCAPCKASFPAMNELYQELKDEGFIILAVSVDSTEKAYKEFAETSAVSFSLIYDAEKQLVKAAEIEVMPTSIMVDKQGIIRSIHKGYSGKKTIDAYRKEIKALLAE
jgi:thiol-disulfide isomerase/thioredoxin